MLTGALASKGLQSPSSLPISRSAGSTSSPKRRIHVFVSALETNPSAAQNPRMDGRVSSSRRRSFGITVFGVPATIIWLLIWSSKAEPRGLDRRPTAYSTYADRIYAENYPVGVVHTWVEGPSTAIWHISKVI